jgi:hypothetical protein
MSATNFPAPANRQKLAQMRFGQRQLKSPDGFHFGLETEFMLVTADTFHPLWHTDLKFKELNCILETIPSEGFSPEGMDIDPCHSHVSPFVVEGYYVPDLESRPVDILPKGVEIRTPICASIEECISAQVILHERMQNALNEHGYKTVILSFHPTASKFEAPRGRRRYDYWQWEMEAMTTYGPDFNISLPSEMAKHLDLQELHAKVNYYIPALVALGLASPLYQGGLWKIRNKIGKSVRTYHRSTIAPALQVHNGQTLRLEFKPFEMGSGLDYYRSCFLVCIALILDDKLNGRATEQTRIYDLGRVAVDGLKAETVRERAAELLNQAPKVLQRWGFDLDALSVFQQRLDSGRLPADDIIELFMCSQSIPQTLQHLVELQRHAFHPLPLRDISLVS